MFSPGVQWGPAHYDKACTSQNSHTEARVAEGAARWWNEIWTHRGASRGAATQRFFLCVGWRIHVCLFKYALCICVRVGMHVYTCTCVLVSKYDQQYYFSEANYLVFWDSVPHWDLGLTILLVRLVYMSPRGTPTWITREWHHAWLFQENAMDQTQVLMFLWLALTILMEDSVMSE